MNTASHHSSPHDPPYAGLANRGIWEAIATAGPAASFAHVEADIDHYLSMLNSFLDEII
jgi:glutamate-1-semialdehyde 2,1-aminomutase